MKWRWLIVGALLTIVSACAAVTPPLFVNWISPAGHYAASEDIPYAPAPRQKLDVYRPAAPHSAHPVIVFFYGGSWNRGARADYRFVAAALTARGFVVVIPDYRLYPQVRYPLFLEDCAAAVGWTLRNIERYGGDPHRVYLLGHSAGAYNAAMLALDPRWLAGVGFRPGALKGWGGLAGPYHFLPSTNPEVQPVFMHPNYPLGAQPIEHVRAAQLPAFIAAASGDILVDPQQNSAQLAAQLQQRGVPVSLKIYPRVNHVTLIGAFAWPLRFLAPVLDDVTNYFLQID